MLTLIRRLWCADVLPVAAAIFVGVVAAALLASPVHAVTITIDGLLTDWSSQTASFVDSSTDAGGGSDDITKVWFTADSTNVYIRWDTTLAANKNKIVTAGFSTSFDLDGNSTIDARIWVLFNAQGVATTELEKPIGTFATLGTAQQNCNVVVCANGAASSIEVSMSLANLGVTSGAVIGIQAETRASASHQSAIKDCLPGVTACTGFVSVNTTTGVTTVTNVGHSTTTAVSCTPGSVATGATTTCTITVTDTSGVGAVTPTGAVTVRAASGTVTDSPCTLSAVLASNPPQASCTVTYSPVAIGSVTLTAAYAGDTSPTILTGSSNTTNVTGIAAPSVTTNAATSVTMTAATLNGSVNANGASSTVRFVYSTVSDLTSGTTTTAAAQSPVTGTSATPVTLAVTGLSAGTRYYFQVTATNSAGTTTGSILSFTTMVLAAPTVTSVAASSGPAAGGTVVTITGTGFTATPTVTFGGTAATNVMFVNATTITATTPAKTAGAVNIVVTNPDTQAGTGAGLYTYVAAPTVISMDVIGGVANGFNTVIITGTNFSTNPTVRIGGNAATNVLRLSATSISARLPVGLVGLRTVQVTNTDTQVGAVANLYRYYDLTTSVASTTPTVTVPILVPVETLHSNTSATTVEATTTNMRRTGVEARDTAVRVTVPVGAIPTASRIIVEPVASLANLAQTAPTSGTSMLAAVSAQALDADGNAITTNFTTPVTIAVTVPADSVPSGAAITSFSMQFWSGTQWRDVASTGVLNNDGSVTLTASTLHFTMFAAKFTAPAAAVTNCCSNLVTPQVFTAPIDGSRSMRALAPNTATLTAGESTVVRGNVVNTTPNGGEEYGSDARITVPAGAVSGGTSVVLQSLDSVRDLVATAPLTGGRLVAALSAQVLDAAKQPITTNFTKAVTISITLPVAALSGVDTAGLQLIYWSGTEWVVVPAVVKANADGSVTVSADVTHFTVYAVSVKSAAPVTPATAAFASKPVYSASKQAQAVFMGGTLEALEQSMLSEGAAGAWAQDGTGRFQLYIAQAGVVNADFVRVFPKGFAGPTAITLIGK